ncbi:MAG TPA: proline racemase family protein [Thermomicrobiaceae bacterium]|nr:proline racemase family protein [Thermomicrobiaceae bacterium]
MPGRRTITTIDAHAGGEPLRLVTAGVPPLAGSTMLERCAEMLARHDDVRRALMWEPRGHADMYGAVLTPPVTPEADYGVLFMHNEGYSSMCGHGVIAVTTILLETGMFPAPDGASAVIRYDSPAGLITARARLAGGRVTEVVFENVPSFVFAPEVAVETEYGTVRAAVVFGGAFYALVDAAEAGLDVRPGHVRDLIAFGMAVKRGVEHRDDVVHPLEPGLRGIYGTIIAGEPDAGADGRNVTIFADGEVDRSPCGTGTAARLAWLHATGRLVAGQPFVHESIVGSRFTGRVLRETAVGPLPAIVPEISGRAYLTGFHTFVVEADDPLGGGFLVR